MMVCLKKMFNVEIICHLKRRLKRLYYYKWKAGYTLLSSSGLKKLHISIISTSHPFERGTTKYCHGHEVLCSNKGTNWKVIFPWKKINWHDLQIPNADFNYLIWLLICGKSIVYAIFIMVMHACTKSQSKQNVQNKLFTRISYFFSP